MHYKRISKKRFNKEETEKKYQSRDKPNVFRIDDEWLNDDRVVYNEMASKHQNLLIRCFTLRKLKS